jgi:hypothetical protein
MDKYVPSPDEARNFFKIPCMRDSLLRGFVGGFALGLLWGGLKRSSRRFGDGLFLGFGVTASVSWMVCRHNERVRREALQRVMIAQSRVANPEEVPKD